MYPVTLGYIEAERRIRGLLQNGHHAEALLTTMFTFEKTLRRAIRFCAISRGFTSKQADILLDDQKFYNLENLWRCFAPTTKTLPARMENPSWQYVKKAQAMRNALVHGKRVYDLSECEIATENLLIALNTLRQILTEDIKFDVWSRLPRRTNSLLGWCPPANGDSSPQRTNSQK